MQKSIRDYYVTTLSNYQAQLNKTFDDETARDALSVLHNSSSELDLLIECVSGREIIGLLLHAKSQYCRAINSAAMSDYRYANYGLRLFLESFLAGIHFSSNDLHFRNWKREQFDILWSKLSCKDTGPLSKNFVSAYCDELTEETKTFHTLASKVYRECSEYVHANFKTHLGEEEISEFNRDEFLAFAERTKTVLYVCKFLFCVRFLKVLNKDAKGNIEDTLLDDLSHLAPVNYLLGVD